MTKPFNLFQEVDIVLCPPMPCSAFQHDHAPQRSRHLEVDGSKIPYNDLMAWAGIATLNGLPATTMPNGRTESGLRIGVQIVGGYLEDLTCCLAKWRQRACIRRSTRLRLPRSCWRCAPVSPSAKALTSEAVTAGMLDARDALACRPRPVLGTPPFTRYPHRASLEQCYLSQFEATNKVHPGRNLNARQAY